MSDDADELILKMQHLEAQAKAQAEARHQGGASDRLKSAAQKLAWKAQQEVQSAERDRDEAEAKMEALRASGGGVDQTEAPDYVAAQDLAREAERRIIRARAQLNFALDRLSEVERREYEATVAEARAEFHGQMAEDPLFKK